MATACNNYTQAAHTVCTCEMRSSGMELNAGRKGFSFEPRCLQRQGVLTVVPITNQDSSSSPRF
eukprot:5295700-Amphidinium_carterae.1